METEQDIHDMIQDAIRLHADPALARVLHALNATVAGYPDGVSQHVREGLTAGVLAHVSPDFTALDWLASQQTKLDEDAGLLALRETQAQLTALRARYADYGVDVRELVAEC